MHILILSDIHGAALPLKHVLEHNANFQWDYIVLLGDYLNHGPRNPLPQDYNPQAVADLLNQLNSRIIAVRGNCDSEVDQYLLNFPMMSDYHCLYQQNGLFMTHGHLATESLKLPHKAGDIHLSGHTHIPLLEIKDYILYMNPGSISLPKGGHPPTYGRIIDQTFTILTTQNEIYMEVTHV